MEVIICNYNEYENIHKKLVLEEKTDNYIFVPIEIMGNNEYYYLFNVFYTLEIIIKLYKNDEQENRFKIILNGMINDKNDIEIAKINYRKIKNFVLRLLTIDQFDSIIKKKEEIAFEQGKEAKIREIKEVFKVW